MASNRRLRELRTVPPRICQGALQQRSFSARALHRAGVGEWGPEKQGCGQGLMAVPRLLPFLLHRPSPALILIKTAL